jgi:hypothetical protein
MFSKAMKAGQNITPNNYEYHYNTWPFEGSLNAWRCPNLRREPRDVDVHDYDSLPLIRQGMVKLMMAVLDEPLPS